VFAVHGLTIETVKFVIATAAYFAASAATSIKLDSRYVLLSKEHFLPSSLGQRPLRRQMFDGGCSWVER
jgi:hypothetical protein